MIVEPIETLDIPELKPYRTLRGNTFGRDGSFVADSERVVKMLLGSDLEFVSLLCTPVFFERNRSSIELAGVGRVFLGEKALLQEIVGHKIHHGVMAHLLRPSNVALERMPERVLMLVGLSNMENVGAIARSAAALGVGGYAVPTAGPHPYGRRAIRVSTGHVTRLDVHTYENTIETIRYFRRLGYTVIAAEAAQSAIDLDDIDTIPKKWVLLMGNEEEGIANDVMKECDMVVRIEMEPGVRSLNVSVAASIIMYRFVRLACADSTRFA